MTSIGDHHSPTNHQATSTAEWHYLKDGAPLGPLPFEGLMQRILDRELIGDSLVWHPDFPDWKAIKSVDSLAAFLPKNPGKLQIKRPEPPAAPPQIQMPAATPSQDRGVSVSDLLNHPSANSATKEERTSSSSWSWFRGKSFEYLFFQFAMLVGLVGTTVLLFMDTSEWDLRANPILVLGALLGYASSCVASLTWIIRGFQIGIGWGIGMIFLPPIVGIITLLLHWDKVCRAFFLNLFGVSLLFLTLYLIDPALLKAFFDRP